MLHGEHLGSCRPLSWQGLLHLRASLHVHTSASLSEVLSPPVASCQQGTQAMFFCFFFFFLFRATPMTYGSSQAGGRIRAAPASLHHSPTSHSNSKSKPCLCIATPDPWGQGSNTYPHGSQSGLFPLSHNRNSRAKALEKKKMATQVRTGQLIPRKTCEVGTQTSASLGG